MSYLACYDRFENMKACFYQKAAESAEVSFNNDHEFAVDTETAEFRRPTQEFRAPASPQLPQNELFRPVSKFYQAEFLHSNQTDHDNPAILLHFQRKQAVMKCVFCEIPHLIEFVIRWKSGEAFQKLEHLKIELRLKEIPLNHFLNAIGAKYVGATRKPPTHTQPKVQDDRKLYTDLITSHIYVVRETDNRVVSVMIQGGTLRFGVWNMTEEEFLSMVD